MRKAVLFGLVLILLLSNTSARSHYVILAPVGTRIQYPLNPGYVLGFQDFSYFWGHGNVKNNNTNHGSYIPLRYVPRFSVGGTENDSTERTMGLHFALDLSSASYYNYNNDYNSMMILQVYSGIAFRQRINSFAFWYETAGLTAGSGISIGIYGETGMMFETPFGLIANAGLRSEFGFSSIRETDGLGFSFGVYLGLGWAFGR